MSSLRPVADPDSLMVAEEDQGAFPVATLPLSATFELEMVYARSFDGLQREVGARHSHMMSDYPRASSQRRTWPAQGMIGGVHGACS
jgi:hypothetical protein